MSSVLTHLELDRGKVTEQLTILREKVKSDVFETTFWCGTAHQCRSRSIEEEREERETVSPELSARHVHARTTPDPRREESLLKIREILLGVADLRNQETSENPSPGLAFIHRESRTDACSLFLFKIAAHSTQRKNKILDQLGRFDK